MINWEGLDVWAQRASFTLIMNKIVIQAPKFVRQLAIGHDLDLLATHLALFVCFISYKKNMNAERNKYPSKIDPNACLGGFGIVTPSGNVRAWWATRGRGRIDHTGKHWWGVTLHVRLPTGLRNLHSTSKLIQEELTRTHSCSCT